MDAADFFGQVAAEFFVFGFAGEDFVGLHALARERRRLQGERLRGPTMFAGDVALRDGALFHRVDGLAGFAV